MSMEVHQNHVLKRGGKGGRTIISISEMSTPAPNHRNNLRFTDNHKKEPPNSMVPTVAEPTPRCSDSGVVLARGGLGWGWHKAFGGSLC